MQQELKSLEIAKKLLTEFMGEVDELHVRLEGLDYQTHFLAIKEIRRQLDDLAEKVKKVQDLIKELEKLQ